MRIERDEWRRLAVLTGLLLVAAAAVWLPAYRARADLRHRLTRAEGKLAELGGVRAGGKAELSRLHRQLTDLEREQAALGRVPTRPRVDDLLRRLTRVMTRLGATRPELAIESTQSHDGYQLIPVRLSFRSGFPAAYQVLASVERMDRLVRVHQISMQPIREGKQEQAMLSRPLRVKLELETFVAPASN